MQEKSNQIIYHLALGYLVTWMIAPPLSYGTVFRLLAILCFGIFILRKLIYNDYNFRFYAVIGAFVIGYTLLIALMYGTAVTSKFGLYIFICSAVCASFLLSRRDVESYYWLIPYAIILFIIFNITSLRGIALNPNVMRDLAKNSEDSVTFARQGIGGYSYVYALLLAMPFGVDIVFGKNNHWFLRVISIVFVVTSYMLEWQSAYFMALLLSIFLVPIFLVMKVENRTAKIIMFILMMSLAVASFLYLDSIVDFLMQRISSPGIQRKLETGYEILTTDTDIAETVFLTRYERYVKDLRLIAEKPIWGTFVDDGNHSFVLDHAARYGLPFAAISFFIMLKPLTLRGYDRGGAANTSIALAILVYLFNAFAFSTGAILYILLPIYSLTKCQPQDDEDDDEEDDES